MNNDRINLPAPTPTTSIFSNTNNSLEDSPMMKLFIKRRRQKSAMKRRMGNNIPITVDTGKKVCSKV